MREKLRASIHDINPWLLTGIAIILAVILTTGLNFFFAWLEGGEINPRITMYATIDAVLIPLIIAPVIINILKRVINLEQEKHELEGQVAHHQHEQESAEQRIANLQAISDLAIACAAVAPDADINKLLAEQIQSITGALGVSISEYDTQEQALITRYVSVSGDTLSFLNKILGRNIIGLRSPLSPARLREIKNGVVAEVSDLHQVSFGSIPKSVSNIIHNTFNIGAITGLAFMYSGELWGAAVVLTPKGLPFPDQELAMALANVSAMAMRRQKTEEALQESEARYRALVEMSPAAITMSDLTGNILYCNQQMADLHGYDSVDQVFGTNVLSLFAPEEHAKVFQYLQDALKIEQIDDTPFMLVKRDGSHFPGEIRANLVTDFEGNPAGIIGISRDITERKRAQEEMQKLARTDPLTGLFNRRYFFEIAEKEFAESIRYNRPLSVLILDLDLFKDINDTYGHFVGDQALIHIGELLQKAIRTPDTIARYGGEEFVLLLPETICSNATIFAERLRTLVEDTPVKYGDDPIYLSASFGVAGKQDKGKGTFDQLISNADQALYKAKGNGRNQVVCYREDAENPIP